MRSKVVTARSARGTRRCMVVVLGCFVIDGTALQATALSRASISVVSQPDGTWLASISQKRTLVGSVVLAGPTRVIEIRSFERPPS